jgi:hypothetical protein
MLSYKEKDMEEKLIDFDKPEVVKASITRMSVCNESVSLGYIEESSNGSDPDEEDNSESSMFLKNFSNNI